MRQVPKITDDTCKAILNEFRALGSPRASFCEFVGISKSYLNKWMVNEFIPEDKLHDFLIFLAAHKLSGKCPDKMRTIQKGIYEIKLNQSKKIIQILGDSQTISDLSDYVVTYNQNGVEISSCDKVITPEKQKLYEIIASFLNEHQINVDINRTHSNSYRFMFDDNDIESLTLKVNDSSAYMLSLVKISKST